MPLGARVWQRVLDIMLSAVLLRGGQPVGARVWPRVLYKTVVAVVPAAVVTDLAAACQREEASRQPGKSRLAW